MHFGIFVFGKPKISLIKIYSENYLRSFSQSVLKLVCKFKRTNLRCRKAELDLSFLKNCFENSLTTKLLGFKVSSRSLKSSDAYKQCQIRLLEEEISNKRSIIRQR